MLYNVIDTDPSMLYDPGQEIIGSVDAASPDEAISKVMAAIGVDVLKAYGPEEYAATILKHVEAVPASGTHRGDHARCQPCDSVLADMVEWLHDCDQDTTDATASEITTMVARAYDGGIEQFLLDGQPNTPSGTRPILPRPILPGDWRSEIGSREDFF